jgi:hypothetical protein
LQEENHRLVKYRRLRRDELEELEGEFIKFLASNTVTADDWVKTKAETPEKAEDLLDVFSDIVFEKILEKVEYLEHKRPKDFRIYKFSDDKIQMVGMYIKGETALDLTQNESPEKMMQALHASGADVQFISGEKKFKKTKEMEIFQILEEGALISKDPTLFNTLSALRK